MSKKYLLKVLKALKWIILSLLFIFCLAVLLIRTPYIQNLITQRAISFLEKKIGTEVSLKRIYIAFPKSIVVEDLFLEDQTTDTLLFIKKLSIDTDLWKLTNHEIQLNSAELHYAVANINRTKKDNTFNFDYIIQSFTEESKPTDTSQSSSPWKFAVNEIKLSEIRLLYKDQYEGNDFSINLGDLKLGMDEFDIDKSRYKISSLEIRNTKAHLDQSKGTVASNVKPNTSENDSIPIDIDFNSLHLENVSFNYTHEEDGQKIVTNVGDLKVTSNHIDLKHYLIDLSKADLTNSFVSYQQTKTDLKKDTATQKSSDESADSRWKIKLQELNLSDDGMQYYDFNSPKSNQPFDFNRLWVFELQSTVNDILIDGNDLKADLHNLSLRERCGLNIQSLNSAFILANNTLSLNHFNCITNNSQLALNAKTSLEQFTTSPIDYGKIEVALNMAKSKIAYSDVSYFVPSSVMDSLPIQIPKHATVTIDTKLNGKINDLSISTMHLQLLDSTTIDIQGKMQGLPDTDRTRMDLTLNQLYTTQKDLKSLLPSTLIPSSINTPDWITLKGNIHGTFKEPVAVASMESSDGMITLNGKMDLTAPISYDAQIVTKNLNIGRVLIQDNMGAIDLLMSVKGSGTTMKDLNAAVDVTVAKFNYNSYEYNDFRLQGNVKNYFFSGTALLEDKNLDFSLQGEVSYKNDTLPVYKLNINLRNADFKELHITDRPLKAKATLIATIAANTKEMMNGKISIRNVAVFNGKTLYQADSLLYISINQKTDKSTVAIRSDIISGDFTGTFNLFTLPQILKRHVNRYFSLNDSTVTNLEAPQNFKFTLSIKSNDFLTDFILPDLQPILPGKIEGEFDSKENTLIVDVDLARLKYASTGIDSLSFRIKSDKDALKYRLSLKNIMVDTLHLHALRITGKIANDSIRTALTILDSLNEKSYTLAGEIQSNINGFRFHFIPDRIMLNYKKWNAPDDNYFEFGNKLIKTNNFSLSKGNEKISLISARDSSLLFQFQNFQLSNLTKIFSGVIPATGELSGQFKLAAFKQGEFNSKLDIHALAVLGKPWGNAVIKLNYSLGKYDLNLNVSGKETNIVATAVYNTDPKKQSYSLDLHFNPFDLALLEPLSLGQLKDVKGLAKGELKVSNDTGVPSINGKLSFNNSSFVVSRLNNSFTLDNETISFHKDGITFDDFKIKDIKNNEVTIKGDVLTQNYKTFSFNLRMIAKEFQLLNTTKKDNDLYFGLVKISGDAKITGDTNEPNIKASVSFSNDSDLTYVVPEDQKTVQEQKGIVRFVSKNKTKDPFIAGLQLDDTTQVSFFNLNLTADITLRDKSTLNIVIDPVTGDKLSVNGNATLLLDMDGSGNTNLSGRYEVTKGFYNFSFHNLAKRQFTIEKGGSIVWSGDPLNATMDLKARYDLEASPLDLVYNQINTANQSEINSYSQRLPFIVYLMIKGKLLVPQISFALDMPDNKRNIFGGAIYSRLQDINTRESDLNKQVFALMILKRFISDNPFESRSGSGLSNTARASVSRLLSEQLNRLSENVKGVKLVVDVKSYNTYTGSETQGQTKLQLGVSKNLFNDRLVVKLSGNVDIEGQKNEGNASASDYIGDLALEYKLTSDGRLRVTGFRNSNFDMIDGGLTETGTGLIYIKDYNTLRELFRSNAKEK
ncbi:MAG TPA: translocation/assembly module TamB domain-containing protein [Cyclobacteriaceae bacterium]|nr:translocation/assembly module TamB domain-containing protein [Cyclobacteriaceae bacterium]